MPQIQDRKAPHLKVCHIARDFFDLLIVKTIFDVLCHDFTHFRVWPFSFCDTADRNVAISNHAYQVVLLANREQPRSLYSLEGNMCGTAMRGADALPGSKATSRAKGSHRKLGGLGSDRNGTTVVARIGKVRSRSR